MQLRKVFRRKPFIPLVAGGTLVLTLVILFATGVLQHWFGRSQVTEPHYIGVLPFNLIGGDSTKMVLCEGIYDRVVSGLIRMHGALGKSHVCPASEMRKYRGKDLRQAREGSSITLGVEGTIQWVSGQVRATVTVVETDQLASIDSREVSVTVASLSELELKLINAIAEMLGGKLTAAQMFDLAVGTTKDEKAYDYYARGRVNSFPTQTARNSTMRSNSSIARSLWIQRTLLPTRDLVRRTGEDSPAQKTPNGPTALPWHAGVRNPWTAASQK